jgi:hypothetical protein
MTALNEKCILIKVETKTARFTKVDKALTGAAADAFDTTDTYVTGIRKQIDVKQAVIRAPTKIASAAGNYLDGKSPGALDGKYIAPLAHWDGGFRVLPLAMERQVVLNLGESGSLFYAAVAEVKKALPPLVNRAKAENPKLFQANEFDDIERLVEEKYLFTVRKSVITDTATHVLLKASKEYVAEITKEITDHARKREQEIVDNTIGWVIDIVTHLAGKLEDYDPEKKGKATFRDSTFTKVLDAVPVIRALNIHNDARIDQVATDLVTLVGNKNVDTVRKDDATRAATAKEARDIANNITAIFN